MPATTISSSKPSKASIPVRRITIADANAALHEGWADFMEMRGDLIFVGLIYVLVGLVAATAIMGGALLPLLFPIVAGVGLLGPIAALGFYEMARRRESGLHSNWQHFLDVRKRPGIDEISAVAALLLGIFVVWIFVASALYIALFGWWEPDSIGAFVSRVFTTPEGWALIVIGNAIGLAFSALVLGLSVVSLPMLVDCDISASEAVSTSWRAARENPGVMLRWGIIVAALLVLGSIPLFVGLAVVLPWLGYATWHLYTKLVDRSAIKSRRD
ncbi:DUF2189 domain-containing protein [Sphingomonas daechungensis]|uniref:DUF2189 domain-containing protein n=1 Tax=Sphingomonas daechungensis TaxID=1176646 RepID=UPI003782F393